MHIDNLHIIVCNIMNIFSVSPSFCSSIPVTCSVYVIDYAKCPSPGTENSERNSFSVLHGWKIAFSRPCFPSLGTENNINAL